MNVAFIREYQSFLVRAPTVVPVGPIALFDGELGL